MPLLLPNAQCFVFLNVQLIPVVVVVEGKEGSDVPASLPKSSMSCLLHQSLFQYSVCGVF